MKSLKKIIFTGLILIFLVNSLTTSSFAKEEKDYINQTLKYLNENKYNEAIEELEEVLVLVKNKAELKLVNLFFCEEDPQMFGIYNIRANTVFTQDDVFYMYGEPKNFTYKEIQEGIYQLHFKGEIYLLSSDNNVVFGEINFLDFPLTSHVRNSEIFISAAIPVKNLGIDPGDYKFRLVLKDAFSQKTAESIIEFSIIENANGTSASAEKGIIKSWKGTGMKTTEPFNITKKPWKINYSGGGSLLQIYVYDMDNNLIDLFQSTDDIGDTSFVYNTGNFHLNISGMDEWEVKIAE